MADEIDIEEHDVMDNPTIRRIFPDLSVIKKEISKYYEEGPDTKPEPVSEPLNSSTELTCDTKDFSTDSNCPDISDTSEESGRYLTNNVIILGSKPNKLSTEKLNLKTIIERIPNVKLQNISLYLNKTQTFCKECMVLFPRKCAFDTHKKLVHDHRNKNDINIKRKCDKKRIPIKKHKCNICSSVLSSSSNLIRHLRNIHKVAYKNNITIDKYKRNDDEAAVESLDSENGSNVQNTDANCFHCHKVFPTQKELVDHLYDILEPKKIDCKKCTMRFSNQENLEKHVNSIHSDNYPAFNGYDCHKCAIKFMSKSGLDHHNLDEHKTINAKLTRTQNAIDNSPICSDLDNEELAEKDDEPVILPKRTRRTAINNSNSPAETAEYKLRQENNIKNNKITSEDADLKNENNINSCDEKIQVKKAYQCHICSQYVITFMYYRRHMANYHKLKKVPKGNKVLFDSKCKFCVSKLVNIKSYNLHIFKYHNEIKALDGRNAEMKMSGRDTRIKAFSKSEDHTIKSFSFKSVLYKCIKCDICFLTAKTAINHSEHMEVLINWKCCVCNRIFKKIDKALHVKQHSNSHSFTVYNICEPSWNLVLYLCLKCTIHFSEDSFVGHYSTCGQVTPDSVYCKICDSLISRVDFDSHNQIHAINKEISASDFIIVKTDLIIENASSNCIESKKDALDSTEIILKKMIHETSRYYLTFCNSCQCIMSFMARGRRRDIHLKARCKHLKKHTCKDCGIMFTVTTFKAHKMLHQQFKGLNIQNFTFFDLFNKPIRPPIPTYPSCNICGVHFLSRNDIVEHECNGYDYLKCHVCQIKLDEIAFKFHMQFHEYSMKKRKDIPKVTLTSTKAKLNKAMSLSSSKGNELDELEVLYSCKICKITFDAYDPVIKHCQSHYDRRKAPVGKQSCQYCALNFHETYYKIHEQMHLRANYNVQSMKMMNFDPFYFCLDNNFWLKHIFGSLSVDQIENIIGNSIYRFECRLKMDVFQHGPSNSTLYECEKCLTYVDPGSLYLHAENPLCINMKKYTCMACGMCFDTGKCKMDHEILHEHTDISLKSYRIVKTNKRKDEIFHNTMFKSRSQFIMYQCRSCLVSVDKPHRHNHRCVFQNIVKCSHCGLLFCKQEYYTHTNRHKQIKQFNTNHIAVIFFGKKLYKGNQKLAPSFKGKTFDFTFYKCTTCELCIKTKDSTFKHKCVFDTTKCKCPKCDLYFLKQELVSHALLHEMDTDFEDNLNIITFDGQPNVKHLKRIVGNKENSSLRNPESTTNNKKNDYEAQHNKISTEHTDNYVKLLKCDCGLHFIDETNARKHYNNCNPNMKISKQHCSKCDLLFTPGELFTHLLTHHGDKKLEFKFDVSFISKDDIKTPLFKCVKCSLHFVHESEVNEHFDECDESGIGGEKCNKCGLRFKMSSLYNNKHKRECEKKYEINVVTEVKNDERSSEHIDGVSGVIDIDNIVTKNDMVLTGKEYSMAKDYLSKIDLSKYDNVIYKCDVCNVYYITENSWKRHVHFLSVYDACSVCGMNFSLQTLSRHVYIHHEKFNLKKDEFVIKSNNL